MLLVFSWQLLWRKSYVSAAIAARANFALPGGPSLWWAIKETIQMARLRQRTQLKSAIVDFYEILKILMTDETEAWEIVFLQLQLGGVLGLSGCRFHFNKHNDSLKPSNGRYSREAIVSWVRPSLFYIFADVRVLWCLIHDETRTWQPSGFGRFLSFQDPVKTVEETVARKGPEVPRNSEQKIITTAADLTSLLPPPPPPVPPRLAARSPPLPPRLPSFTEYFSMQSGGGGGGFGSKAWEEARDGREVGKAGWKELLSGKSVSADNGMAKKERLWKKGTGGLKLLKNKEAINV